MRRCRCRSCSRRSNVDKAREIIEVLVESQRTAARRVRDRRERRDDRLPARTARSRRRVGCRRCPRSTATPDVEETGTTLDENARIKATALAAALGLPAIADDTGLEVDAIDGAPGVHAARYAGPDATYADNVAKLLRELEGVYPALRTARFATVAMSRAGPTAARSRRGARSRA